MSDWTPNQIRELIEQAIKSERHLRDRLRDEDRARFEEYRKSISEALRLQAIEYERRLHDLNNEAKRIKDAVVITVSQDTWKPHLMAFNELKDKVTKQDNSSREMAVILGVIYSSVVASITAAGVVVSILLKG